MSAISPTPSFDSGSERPWWKDRSGLTEYLREVSLFLRRFRSRLKFGERSRSPLRLIRFHFDQGAVWCDFVARAPDPWDAMLPPHIGRRHASLQALKGAIDTRSLIFASLEDAQSAVIRVYRSIDQDSLETVIVGNLMRHEGAFRHIHSLAMRAKLLGFRFRLEEDILHPLRSEDLV